MKSLKISQSDVGAVLMGFTTEFSFYDILLANVFLDNSQCHFLQEAPDATFFCQSDCGQKFLSPCRQTDCINLQQNNNYCYGKSCTFIGLMLVELTILAFYF